MLSKLYKYKYHTLKFKKKANKKENVVVRFCLANVCSSSSVLVKLYSYSTKESNVFQVRTKNPNRGTHKINILRSRPVGAIYLNLHGGMAYSAMCMIRNL